MSFIYLSTRQQCCTEVWSYAVYGNHHMLGRTSKEHHVNCACQLQLDIDWLTYWLATYFRETNQQLFRFTSASEWLSVSTVLIWIDRYTISLWLFAPISGWSGATIHDPKLLLPEDGNVLNYTSSVWSYCNLQFLLHISASRYNHYV